MYVCTKTDRQTDRPTDRPPGRQTERHRASGKLTTDTQAHGRTQRDGPIDANRWTERWMGGKVVCFQHLASIRVDGCLSTASLLAAMHMNLGHATCRANAIAESKIDCVSGYGARCMRMVSRGGPKTHLKSEVP